MEQPNTKTFCVAPWFQIRNENDLHKKVCCSIDKSTKSELGVFEHLNSEANLKLKKDLHNGIQNKNCEKCWKAEQNNVRSLRQTLNASLLNNQNTIEGSWLTSYFKRKENWLSDRLLMADVHIGNTCNHACIMCIPADSSLIYNHWQKSQDNEFVKEVLDKDPKHLERIKMNGFKNKKYEEYFTHVIENNPNLRVLKIIGGEPLLDKNLLRKLQELDDEHKQRLSIWIVTNGSVNLNDTVQKLGNFKGIFFAVSVEGVGQVHEYARYGSNWQQLESNILSFKQSNTRAVTIHHTIQASTLLGLEDLSHWCNSNNIPISLGFVKHPDYLSVSAIPNHVREAVIEKAKANKILVKENTLSDEPTLSAENMLHTLTSTEFSPHLYQRFLRFVDWYEENKADIPKLKDIFPQLYEVDNQSRIN
jgi:uncharacterized Fe-S cluster-containing radical SAM superfamily protein